MLKTTLFMNSSRIQDRLYETVRDSLEPIGIKAKRVAESLWEEYEPYADPDFLEKVAEDFQARYWEMFLTTSLLRAGCTIMKKLDPEGPDIHLKYGDKSIWIEAVAPNSGDPLLPDSVPPFIPMDKPGVGDVPDNQLKLRILNAISEKHKKWQDYINNRIIGVDEPYIIAVNTCKIPLAFIDRDPPRIVRCVFDIGHPYVTFDGSSGKILESGTKPGGGVKKSKGEVIPTNIFLNGEYKGVSAIFWSHINAASAVDRIAEGKMTKDYFYSRPFFSADFRCDW